MNRKTLLAFMQRILENGSAQKSRAALNQLVAILAEQSADPEMVRLVHKTIEGLPEAKEAAKNQILTEETLQIALRRAEDRRRREEAAARQGRC